MRLTHSKLWHERTCTEWFYLHSKIKSSFLGMHTFIECKNITKNKVSSRVAIAPSRKRGLALSEEGNTCGGINHVSDLHPRAGNRSVLCTFLHVCQSWQCKIFCYFNSNTDDFTAYRNLKPYFHENCLLCAYVKPSVLSHGMILKGFYCKGKCYSEHQWLLRWLQHIPEKFSTYFTLSHGIRSCIKKCQGRWTWVL